jgi:hypothetical protein
MCPHCGRDAPLVYRGPLAYCSACNKARVPLSAAGVNLTGKPAKLGGTLASVLGWVVLAVMLAIALILGAIFQAIFPPGAIVGWAIGGVVAALGIAAALVLLLGGRFLSRTGDRASLRARRDAVTALAEHQNGIVRADGVVSSLGISLADADRLLTDLSKQPDSGVLLEVDGDGKLYYRFLAFAPEAPWPPLGAAPPPDEIRVRVQKTEIAQPVRAPAPAQTLSSDPLDEPIAAPGSTKRTQV